MAEQRRDYLEEALRITDEIIRLWEEVGIDVENASFKDAKKNPEEWEEKKKK